MDLFFYSLLIIRRMRCLWLSDMKIETDDDIFDTIPPKVLRFASFLVKFAEILFVFIVNL